ncbi:unnamed protein product [Rotaria magnacalcarata]|uniref:C2H2-type domain-containing protein n=1 Tax=Rotaria magnacalcarata TaxID=392030 RepID=A0A818WG35_9BILA|nr:unnamed protein product [Rotaria magnacalcarata]CAF3725701.1 unnamed protein product [Rotaria magnacalcarata]
MADPDSPSNDLSSVDEVHQTSSNHQEEHQQQEPTVNDWPWSTDDHHQQNAIDSSGLMHLIATGGGATVDSNPNDESVGMISTHDQTNHEQQVTSPEQLTNETMSLDQQSQLPLVTISSSSGPMDIMDTDAQITPNDVDQPQSQVPLVKTQHDIAEIHRDMLTLIPIPQAWSHVRHQSGLFSYPDLPHFNVIRQATFRDGRFVCPFCTVDFASKEGIRYHLYNSCTKSPYPKAFFRCLMCGSELADRSSLRTHLARHSTEEGGAVATDKIDVSRKPALPALGETSNSKKSKKKKKNSNDITPPQMMNSMMTMASGVSPHTMDNYNIPPTMLNQHMSLPIIKSELNDNDPKRKRGRPPKTKSSDGPTPIASYTKQTHLNPTGLALTPTMNNPIMINEQLVKSDPHKASGMRSPRGVDISSELAELARSRMREHIEFATDTLLPEQEQEINTRLRTEGAVQCHRCRGKTQFTALKKLKEHLKTDCPLGPVMAVCKFCGIPFSSVSSVCDHLELYHDDSHDTCPDDPCRINDRAFRAAFARYKFPMNGHIPFSASATTIGQLVPENESAACLSNGASCLRVRMLSCDRFLNPLDSFAASHVIVLNVGRPIRCIEWLPRAVDIIGSQYVALALEQWSYDTNNQLQGSYTNPDRRSPPGSTLLLILNCGRLRQSLHVPNLHVTVAADFGQVTCLKWLPDRPTINDPYLSYLAIGTSQGIVIIFGVPHGASRNLCTINSGAQLVPPLNRRKDGSIGCAEYGSCTALDWCHENPNKLCAGYENGIVLMWEVNSKSLVEQTTNCSLIYPVRRFFVEDTAIQDVKFMRNSEHLIAVSLKNKQSWTVWTTRDENIFCYRHWSNASEFASSILNDTLYAGCAHANNHNELLSVPLNSILLPGQNVSTHLQTSMLSAWQIVSLDYSEWIDAAAYADLDGTVWVARGDSSTWAQNNPKFRPSTCVAKLSTYLTGVGGAQAGNLTDPVAMQQYNQGQAVVPTGQYCVQITIERTEYASGNIDSQHDETHKVHTYRKIRFNPNPGTHGWIASADKVGLFLLFRLSTSDSPLSEKLTQRLQRVQVV